MWYPSPRAVFHNLFQVETKHFKFRKRYFADSYLFWACLILCKEKLGKIFGDTRALFVDALDTLVKRHFPWIHSGSIQIIRNTLRKGGVSWQWLNFINVLCTAFMHADPKSVKIYWWLTCIFYTFGIYEPKSFV